jgi:hypothetical protein
MVLEVSVHGHLTLLLWGCGDRISWWKCEVEEPVYFMATGKQRESQELLGFQTLLQGGTVPMT